MPVPCNLSFWNHSLTLETAHTHPKNTDTEYSVFFWLHSAPIVVEQSLHFLPYEKVLCLQRKIDLCVCVHLSPLQRTLSKGSKPPNERRWVCFGPCRSVPCHFWLTTTIHQCSNNLHCCSLVDLLLLNAFLHEGCWLMLQSAAVESGKGFIKAKICKTSHCCQETVA